MEGTDARETGITRPNRRVSISDQSIMGLDNPGFEHHRKVSGSSEIGTESRRKSCISVSAENIENGCANGGRKKSSMSLSGSIREKIEYTDELKRQVYELVLNHSFFLHFLQSFRLPIYRYSREYTIAQYLYGLRYTDRSGRIALRNFLTGINSHRDFRWPR